MSFLEEFDLSKPLFNSWVKNWKEIGKKVVGYFCSYIPEELLYAADILPIRVRARTCTDTPLGDAYMSSTTCSYTRCCLELSNRKELNFIDGIVSCNCCDQIRRLYDNIRYKTPFKNHYIIGVPGTVSPITLDWYKHEINKFKAYLETTYEVNVTDEKLNKAISTYNKSRELLSELYETRKGENPPVTGTETLNIINSSVSIPKSEFNAILEKKLQEIKRRDGFSNYKSRIMIVGSMLDDPEYLAIIEDLGGLVVTDSLCIGSRYFWDKVDESKNPIDALAERYLSKTACPRMTGGYLERANYVMKLIREFNVDGVIFERMKFCALWWSEIFMLKSKLKEEEIPYLELEREYVLSGTGAMKTRVQTFMEILEAR